MAYFNSSNASSDIPCYTINYRAQDGLESYWTYLSQSVDGAGTGYINVATGGLVFSIDTLATTDGLFGFSPSLVYNSTNAGEYITNTYNTNSPYKHAFMGRGWRLSVNETLAFRTYVDETGAVKPYYVWTDSDGTEHAFYSKDDDSGEYQDEDGLLLTLRSTDEGFTIEDSSHNVRHFKTYLANSDIGRGAILTKISDKFGNSLDFKLDDRGRVETIGVTPADPTPEESSSSDPVLIPYLVLIYDEVSNCLSQIKNLATYYTMTFEYSSTATGTSISSSNSGYLRRVTYSYNGTNTLWTAEYNYNSAGMLISAVNTTSKLGIHYDVNSVTKRVGVAYETGNGNNGQRISFIYGTDFTQVRSSGSDDVFATDDDIMTNYVFDRQGRTISTYSTNTNGTQIYGATTGTYSDEATNRIKTTAVSGGSAVNYIVNSNFERSTSLTYWAGSGVSGAVGFNDTRVAKISVVASASRTLTQYVSLESGTYTLSMDMFTQNCEGVTVTVSATSLSNSTHTYTKTLPVNEVCMNGKLTPSLTFTVNNGSSKENFRIRVTVKGGATVASDASVQVDNVMLQKAVGSSAASVLNLGSFESSSINSSGGTSMALTTAWTVNGSGVELGTPCGIDGNGVKIIGTAASEQSVSQTVKILPESLWGNSVGAPYSKPANFYVFSGFASGTHQASGGFFGFRVTVKPFSGDEAVFSFPCVNDVTYNQFVSGFIVLPAYFFVKEITIECVYENTGVAYFDNVSLVPLIDGKIVDYRYTEEGRTKAIITPEGATYYEYNENGDVTLEANEYGSFTRYEYNTNHSLKNSKTGTADVEGFYFSSLYDNDTTVDTDSIFSEEAQGLVTSYVYDTYGFVTQTNTYWSSNPAQRIRTSSSYDTTSGSKSFGKQLTYTDENGDMSKYRYYSDGSIQCQISPNGTGLHYTYDIYGRLTEVVPSVYSPSVNTYYGAYGEEDVKYLYNALNQLSGITTATTEYSFTYDQYGNTTSIKAGDHTLVTYTYNNYNGKMSSMTYGNDPCPFTYQYDALDRLEKVCYNYSVIYEYQYTSDGKLHCVNDYQSGVGYLYGYDSEGKLSEYTEYDLDDMTNELAIAYKYNDRGQIEQVSSSIDYASFYNATSTLHLTEHYAYDDVDPMTFLLEEYAVTSDARLLAGTYVPSDFTIQFEYDGMERLTGKTIMLDGLFDFTHEISYAYADRSSGKLLSSQVSTYTTEVGNNAEKVYGYIYDSNGNITKITENGTTITQYTYDNLGQLIREDDLSKNLYYVYAYDNNGNRTSKTTYNYTTGAFVNLATYGYGDDSWGDLLTTYNGMSITYDNIGNPLSYYNGTRFTFTWSDGRRLASAIKTNGMGGTIGSYSFTYNDEGIRTSKTSDGVTHYYTLDGTRIVSEEWGNYFAVYVYDESGSPIGMHIRQNTMMANEFYTYYFEKNLQGDIIGVYNSGGTLVYSYAYDAWGNFTATSHSTTDTFASYNPFRYRGYYYDSDLGFYYLNSRYYDPITGRFLNADDSSLLGINEDIMSFNYFLYCSNNPILGTDPSGYWTFSLNLSFGFGFFGCGYSFSIGISVDSDEMVAFQWSYSVPNDEDTRNTVLGVSANAGVNMQYTNLESVSELENKGKYAGVNTPVLGVNGVMTEQNELVGVDVGLGPSFGGDAHVNETYTRTIVKFRSFLKWFKDTTGWLS